MLEKTPKRFVQHKMRLYISHLYTIFKSFLQENNVKSAVTVEITRRSSNLGKLRMTASILQKSDIESRFSSIVLIQRGIYRSFELDRGYRTAFNNI